MRLAAREVRPLTRPQSDAATVFARRPRFALDDQKELIEPGAVRAYLCAPVKVYAIRVRLAAAICEVNACGRAAIE
jgi:hypothetical protein